ncbi:MAG: SEC-C domain-containing protein [Caldilineaceae bacterium]|nr:SEC-C domain-containing protein [Caldilineaceae bacterium]MBP8109955.1 SEC-C domain-containing protein [Caldilineaceae bacterium]MBP8124973.1 SEC-C domain-containing protein [Caldilineaceae bacterium]MBP9074762.1 SEC-C domain-containing protein [Caldilineaceae bacterium]
MNIFKRILGVLDILLPLFALLVISFLATAIVLLLGWLFSLVTPLTMWQAVVIASVSFLLSTYTLYTRLPPGDPIPLLIILTPFAALAMLIITLPLVWLIPLVSPFDPWQSAQVGAAMTLMVSYVVLGWILTQTSEAIEQSESLERLMYDDDGDDEDWEEFIDELDEGQYVIIRDRDSGLNLLLAADSISPDEPCPCESGRKYRNCHGQGQVQSQVAKRRRR